MFRFESFTFWNELQIETQGLSQLSSGHFQQYGQTAMNNLINHQFSQTQGFDLGSFPTQSQVPGADEDAESGNSLDNSEQDSDRGKEETQVEDFQPLQRFNRPQIFSLTPPGSSPPANHESQEADEAQDERETTAERELCEDAAIPRARVTCIHTILLDNVRSGNKVLEGEYNVLSWYALERQAFQEAAESTGKPRNSFELVKSEAIVRPFKQGRVSIPFTFRRPLDVTLAVEAIKAEATVAGPSKLLQITVSSELKTKGLVQATAPQNPTPIARGGAAPRGTPRPQPNQQPPDPPNTQQTQLASASNNRPATQTPGPKKRQTATTQQLQNLPDLEQNERKRSNFSPLIMKQHLCQDPQCGNSQGGWCWEDGGQHYKITNGQLKQWSQEIANREAGAKSPPGWLATKIKAEGPTRKKRESPAQYNTRKGGLTQAAFTPSQPSPTAPITQYFYSQPPPPTPLPQAQVQATETEPPRSSPPLEDNPKERVFAFWRWRAGRNANEERQARFRGIAESFIDQEFSLQGVKYYEKDYGKENFLQVPVGLLKGLANDVRRFEAEQAIHNNSGSETEVPENNEVEQRNKEGDSQQSNAELV